MKRHQQLQPLSRQHHNGLLAAMLLKKGIAKAADANVMATFIIDFWKQDLKDHFESEEKVLVPALTGTSFNQSLNKRLLEEHELLRSYIYSLQNKPAAIPAIKDFTDRLEQHIRFEERKYFPEAEKVLTEEQMKQIGKQLKDNDAANCINYPIKFWG
jgi:hemerythrin-like domain-containing protein